MKTFVVVPRELDEMRQKDIIIFLRYSLSFGEFSIDSSQFDD